MDVANVFIAPLAKIIALNFNGKNLVQTSPAAADKTINHARKLISIFETPGIPKTRAWDKTMCEVRGILEEFFNPLLCYLYFRLT